MGIAAEAQPAQLPLPGGREGATVRVEPLLTGAVSGPRAWFYREEGRLGMLRALGLLRGELLRVPVVAFLVEHPGAGRILVDTGFHSSVAVAPRQNLGRIGSFSLKNPEMRPDQSAAAQLRAREIDPASVATIVMTHMHLDHASAISDFPGAAFVLSAREWEAATSDGPLHGYVRSQFDHAFDYRTVDFGGSEIESWEQFGRSADLLGDGSIRLVYTPGHTHGHLSVALRLRERTLLVCGDAAYGTATLERDHLPARPEDEHRFRRSLKEIQLFLRQHPDALPIPGHDFEAWDALDAVYE